MNTQPNIRIVRVTSLAEFRREVPPEPDLRGRKPIVRLLCSHRAGEHTSALALSLQGVNADGEIVWLCEAHVVSWLFGKPFGRPAECVVACMSDLEIIVRRWVEAQGYDTRNSDYGIPDGINPLRASCECARWVKVSEDEWNVEAVYEQHS